MKVILRFGNEKEINYGSRRRTCRASVDCRPSARLSQLPEFSLTYASSSLDTSNGQPDVDHIAISQAEMISQIDVSDYLDDPGIRSIPCRSRRRPQKRFPTIESD